MNITKQNGPVWTDETGQAIPANRLTKAEKLREASAYKLATTASKLSDMLASFKDNISTTCAEVIAAIRAENKIKADGKGNFTWYNFNQSIKVEGNVNEAIKFDEVLIEGAKAQLLELIDENISAEDFIKSIVLDAFQTTSGKLDTRRILGLKRHSSRITNKAIKAKWDAAMELIDKSITRPDSKTYFRIWVKNGSGEYENIDLNFSSVK